MNNRIQPREITLAECKIQASILLKALRQSDVAALKRCARYFSELNVAAIKRKHALEIVAREKRFSSWVELKTQIGFPMGGFLNHWFPNYTDAKAYQHTFGGFLFPYKKQFFVCDADYVAALGFDPGDQDWAHIDKDWAKPNNRDAFQRLYRQWMAIQGEKND